MTNPFEIVGVTFYRSPAASFATAGADHLLEAWHAGEFAYSQTVLVAIRGLRDRDVVLATACERATTVDLGRVLPSHPPAAGDLVLVEGDLYVVRVRGFEPLRRARDTLRDTSSAHSDRPGRAVRAPRRRAVKMNVRADRVGRST